MRIIKVLLIVIALIVCGIMGRLYLVQKDIDNRPVKTSELAESGYTPEGAFGHGKIVQQGGALGWHIYDLPAGDATQGNLVVKKVCAFGGVTEPHMDVDFVYLEGAWVKLRTGTMTLREVGVEVEPKTTKWKGVLRSKTAFNVRRPDLPYRLKILIGKLQHKASSPREYLEGLKRSNPSCYDMPAP